MNGFINFPRLISTTGAVSLVRTETMPQRFAVLLGAVAGEILDTFTRRADADEFYTEAMNGLRAGLPWPDPDAPAMSHIHPDFIVEWAMAKARREEAAALLPCGCYRDACQCANYPDDAAWSAMRAEGHRLLPEREPMTQEEMDAADEVRNFWGRRADA